MIKKFSVLSEVYIQLQTKICAGVKVTNEELNTPKTVETLTAKVSQLAKAFNEKKEFTEGKIRQSPLAYVTGAFTGGMIVGYLIRRGKG